MLLWLSNHDIQLNMLLGTLKVDVLLQLETQLVVDLLIDRMAALKICSLAFSIRLLGHIFDDLPGIPFASARRAGADIDQVPALLVPLSHDLKLCIMQKREELVEEALAAFLRELVVETPQAGTEDREPIVHVVTRWHPRSIVRESLGT